MPLGGPPILLFKYLPKLNLLPKEAELLYPAD